MISVLQHIVDTPLDPTASTSASAAAYLEQSAALVQSATSAPKRRAGTASTPTNTAAKRRQPATISARPTTTPGRKLTPVLSEPESPQIDPLIFLNNDTDPPYGITTPEPLAPLPGFKYPKTSRLRAIGVIPRGFYKVSADDELYLTKQITACSFKGQLELKRWGADGWAHLFDPPSFLEVNHFVHSLGPDITNDEAASLIQLANRNLIMAKLRATQYTDQDIEVALK